jgi:hypothetical protein
MFVPAVPRSQVGANKQMSEWLLFVTMLTGGRPTPPPVRATVIQDVRTTESKLSNAERAELRTAVERLARESTGTMVRDTNSALFVPASGPGVEVAATPSAER